MFWCALSRSPFSEISAPAASDFHLGPPPSSCFFSSIPRQAPCSLTPLSLCLLQLACPLPWDSSGIHCLCFNPQAAGFVSYPCSQLVQHGSSQQGLPPTCSPFLDSSSIPLLIPPQFSWNLATRFQPQCTFSIDDFCGTFTFVHPLNVGCPRFCLASLSSSFANV